MSNPLIRIHNSQTDEIIDRPMTDDEYAQFQLEQALELENLAKAEAQATAKAALLERLGITEDEAKLLLG